MIKKIENYEKFNDELELLCETRLSNYHFDIVRKRAYFKVENAYENEEFFSHTIELINVREIYYQDSTIKEEYYEGVDSDISWLEFSEFYIYDKEESKKRCIKFNNEESDNTSNLFNISIVIWGWVKIYFYAQELIIDDVRYSLLD